jgi:hypothetical protein
MKRNEPQPKPQLFIIADEVWQNSSIDEIQATVDDMAAMDIFYPPCNHFEILIKAEALPHFFEKHTSRKLTEEEFNSHYKNQYYRIELVIDAMEDWMKTSKGELMFVDRKSGQWIGGSWLNNKSLAEGALTHAAWQRENLARENTINLVINLLLVTLATKNVERKSKPNLMAKQVIRSKALKRDYEYTTTLTIGKVVGSERTEGDLGGWKVRPHLRRGHIREQRYGPNNQLLKKVFIQPVFVNAADGVMSQRKAYNVRVA